MDVNRTIADLITALPDEVSGPRSLLREDVYTRIRAWIVEGHLPPETRLRDNEIAQALQVSRTPVREAIRRLQDEGLVIAEVSRWTKVAPIDIDAADRIYPMVWTLERLALGTAGSVLRDRLAELRATNDKLAEAVAADDAFAASQADTLFHSVIIDAAANPELAAILGQLKVMLRRIEITYFQGGSAGRESIREHERVIAALEKDDLESAGAELEGNWRSSLGRLHQRRRSSMSPSHPRAARARPAPRAAGDGVGDPAGRGDRRER